MILSLSLSQECHSNEPYSLNAKPDSDLVPLSPSPRPRRWRHSIHRRQLTRLPQEPSSSKSIPLPFVEMLEVRHRKAKMKKKRIGISPKIYLIMYVCIYINNSNRMRTSWGSVLDIYAFFSSDFFFSVLSCWTVVDSYLENSFSVRR